MRRLRKTASHPSPAIVAVGLLVIVFLAVRGDEDTRTAATLGLAALSALAAAVALSQAREARYEERSFQLLSRMEQLAEYMSELGDRVSQALASDYPGHWHSAQFTQRKARASLAAFGEDFHAPACRRAAQGTVTRESAEQVQRDAAEALNELAESLAGWAKAHAWTRPWG